MEQFSFRTEDRELILSIEHEQTVPGREQKLSKSAAVQALVQDGLTFRRWAREQSAHHVYSAEQSVQQSAAPAGREEERA